MLCKMMMNKELQHTAYLCNFWHSIFQVPLCGFFESVYFN